MVRRFSDPLNGPRRGRRASAVENWVEQQDDKPLAEACVAFGEFMNRARPSLGPLLAPDCIHESQTRRGPLEGRERIERYFRSWTSYSIPFTFAELATEPDSGTPCLLMHVRDSTYGKQGLGSIRSYITLELDESGLVRRLFAVSYEPIPKRCRRSGVFPGMAHEDLAYELERDGPRVSRGEALELDLFFIRELESRYGDVRASVEEVARDLGLPRPRVGYIGPDNQVAVRLGVGAHPTVYLRSGGKRVLMIEGVRPREELRELLANVLEPNETNMAPPPPDYFSSPTLEESILRRVKGDYRRSMVREAIARGEREEIPEAWLAHELSRTLKDFLGAQNPGYRGGEDLPDLRENEVEIARQSLLNSVHHEVTSLRATDLGEGRLGLRMVGEDQEEIALPRSEASAPLTTEEIVLLFRDAEPSPITTECEFTFSSFFYPDLPGVARRLGVGAT